MKENYEDVRNLVNALHDGRAILIGEDSGPDDTVFLQLTRHDLALIGIGTAWTRMLEKDLDDQLDSLLMKIADAVHIQKIEGNV